MASKIDVGSPKPSVSLPGNVVTEERLKAEVEKSLKEARELKKDVLTSFGVFAALLVFASLEVQVLANVKRFSLMIGMSAFFVSSLLLFVLSLHNVLTDHNDWKDYLKPVFGLILLIWTFAALCFGYAFLTK